MSFEGRAKGYAAVSPEGSMQHEMQQIFASLFYSQEDTESFCVTMIDHSHIRETVLPYKALRVKLF